MRVCPQGVGQVAHSRRTVVGLVQDVQHPQVNDGELVRFGQPAIHRGVKAQRGVQEVLPRLLFGDVQSG